MSTLEDYLPAVLSWQFSSFSILVFLKSFLIFKFYFPRLDICCALILIKSGTKNLHFFVEISTKLLETAVTMSFKPVLLDRKRLPSFEVGQFVKILKFFSIGVWLQDNIIQLKTKINSCLIIISKIRRLCCLRN